MSSKSSSKSTTDTTNQDQRIIASEQAQVFKDSTQQINYTVNNPFTKEVQEAFGDLVGLVNNTQSEAFSALQQANTSSLGLAANTIDDLLNNESGINPAMKYLPIALVIIIIVMMFKFSR